MSFRAEEILNLLEMRSAPSLISSETFAHIKSLGRLLPTGITYGFGFESRLADSPGDVDFILRPWAPEGLEIIAGLDTGPPLQAVLAKDRNWLSLRDLCRGWATLTSPLHKATFCLWIEFDREQLGQAVPSPGLVFVQLQRPYCDRELYQPIADAIHMSLKGCAMGRPIAKALLRCIELMPEKGMMTHFGLPIARPSDALRVVVSELEPDQIPEYVCSAGWKGNFKLLESVIFSMIGYADKHSVNLDLDQQGISNIGIEFGIPQEHSPSSDPRWKLLLDFLVRQGWCRGEKRNALLEWPKRLTLMHDPKPILLGRFISHVKLAFDAGGGVTAKAYVGLVW